MTKTNKIKPEVGMGVTEYLWSDARAYTITQVDAKGKTFAMKPDLARLKKSWKPEFVPGGFHGHVTNNHTQEYDYSPMPDAQEVWVSLRKNGKWCIIGQRSSSATKLELGIRAQFHDYNF